MARRVTIREVAEACGVSISTVHQSLNGKNGVSEATRARVCRAAEAMGYQPNAIASSLKRKTRHILILLPTGTGHNRYYYAPMWQGISNYLETVSDMNVECEKLTFESVNPAYAESIRKARELIAAGSADGLLTAGYLDGLGDDTWALMKQNGIPVVQILSQNPNRESLCSVTPYYEVIGLTMAELVFDRIPAFGSVVLCAGNPNWLPHSLVVQGFERFMAENRLTNRVYYDHSWHMGPDCYTGILRLVREPDVAACASVLSKSSILLGRALEESGKSASVYAVASDLSDENIDRLKRGVFNNLIQKSPYAQGYLGIKTLVEYLTQGHRPERSTLLVGSEVIFRSNLEMYEQKAGLQVLL